jgi:hypothetical protein
MNIKPDQKLTIIGCCENTAMTFRHEVTVISESDDGVVYRPRGKRKTYINRERWAKHLVFDGWDFPMYIDSEYGKLNPSAGSYCFSGNACINLLLYGHSSPDELRARIDGCNINDQFNGHGCILYVADAAIFSPDDGEPLYPEKAEEIKYGHAPLRRILDKKSKAPEPEQTVEEMEAEIARLEAELKAADPMVEVPGGVKVAESLMPCVTLPKPEQFTPGEVDYYLAGGKPVEFDDIPAAEYDKLPDGCKEKQIPKLMIDLSLAYEGAKRELKTARIVYDDYLRVFGLSVDAEARQIAARTLAAKFEHISIWKFQVDYFKAEMDKREAPKLSPMMEQYQRIRAALPDRVILMFRLGDFYEMFFEDAIEASRLLNIALVRRQEVQMCGIPFHAINEYTNKLLLAGRKVAIKENDIDPISVVEPESLEQCSGNDSPSPMSELKDELGRGLLVTLTENEEHDGYEIKFCGPVNPKMLKILAGPPKFRFHGQKKIWYAKRSPESKALAMLIVEKFSNNPEEYASNKVVLPSLPPKAQASAELDQPKPIILI